MNKIQAARLKKLADHLRSDKLGLDRFDFSTYFSRSHCGTAGCAIGECPSLWPKYWQITAHSETPKLIRFDPIEKSVYDSTKNWFGVNEHEHSHLFLPYTQDTETYGGLDLCNTATRFEVADHIDTFLRIKSALTA